MKKVILGTGLLLCGVMGILTLAVMDIIVFASSNAISQRDTPPLVYIAIIFFSWGSIEYTGIYTGLGLRYT